MTIHIKKDLCTKDKYDITSENYSCGYNSKIQTQTDQTEMQFCLDKNKQCKKNRYDENPASKQYRINLCDNKIIDDKPNLSTERKCYINADAMPSLKINGNNIYIIATQAPIQNSINDFKTMVKNYGVKRIIMLTGLYEPNPAGKTIIKINGVDTNIKEKADDYINIAATTVNNYTNTYFTKKPNTNNTDKVTVIYETDDIKVGKIIKDKWFSELKTTCEELVKVKKN